jgi:hypothetical protein
MLQKKWLHYWRQLLVLMDRLGRKALRDLKVLRVKMLLSCWCQDLWVLLALRVSRGSQDLLALLVILVIVVLRVLAVRPGRPVTQVAPVLMALPVILVLPDLRVRLAMRVLVARVVLPVAR